MSIDPAKFEAVAALALGFSFAGLLASTFEMVARRPLGFGLLQIGGLGALASVPVLVFSAPMIILRSAIRARGTDGYSAPAVMLSTVIASGWSLMSGRLVLDVAERLTGA